MKINYFQCYILVIPICMTLRLCLQCPWNNQFPIRAQLSSWFSIYTIQYICFYIQTYLANLLMYSAHLSLRASAPTRHDRQFNEQPNDPGKSPAIPRKEYPWGQGQAWRRDPSGKPTNEERARTAGLFQSPDYWNRDRDHWPFLSTPPSPLPQSPGWPASWPLSRGGGESYHLGSSRVQLREDL